MIQKDIKKNIHVFIDYVVYTLYFIAFYFKLANWPKFETFHQSCLILVQKEGGLFKDASKDILERLYMRGGSLQKV